MFVFTVNNFLKTACFEFNNSLLLSRFGLAYRMRFVYIFSACVFLNNSFLLNNGYDIFLIIIFTYIFIRSCYSCKTIHGLRQYCPWLSTITHKLWLTFVVTEIFVSNSTVLPSKVFTSLFNLLINRF